MASAYVFLLFFMIFQANIGQHKSKPISPGSSLSLTGGRISWDSPSGLFNFGFYKQGSGFSLGVWLLTSPEITIVWTANRDDPPLSSNATLELTTEGKLILKTGQNKDKLIANTMESAAFASMLDSGNFVLQNIHSDIIWSSFSLPTDTILGGQNLPAGSELFSRLSETNHSTGRFRLKMQEDGNLVLYPANTIDEYTEAYWASDTYRKQNLHLYLNFTGELVLVDNNLTEIKNLFSEPTLNKSSTIISRATVDVDGVFRLYYYFYVTEGVYNTTVKWKEPEDLCHVKTFCGLNSYCTLYDDQPICRCLPGTDFVDSSEMSGGCERSFVDQTCDGMNRSREILYNMTLMEKMTWDDYPYSNENMGEEDCKRSCLEDCNCDAVLYKSSSCSKQKLPLKSARRDQGESSSFIAYFKTGQRNMTSNNNGVNFFPVQPQTARVVTSKKAITLILVLSLGFITGSCVFLAISGFFIFKYQVAKYKRLLKTGKFGLNDELTLRSFSYYELKKATKGFREELGRGSFGAVYKGSFHRGEKLVAVKRLEKLVNDGSEREFRAEMLVIGRIHHKNLVGLLGYCYEDSKRLLVYEYMSNGSLADLLFRAERSPDWNERVRIALEVARGILYLHDECEAPIIHCDIKPQNILMDDFWTAKISDFGLAKLLMPDQTRTFTLVRGTRGYMAPEWSKNIPVSVKVDVYSYGVVLLEIVCCRKNLDVNASKPEEIVLINWVYKCFIDRELNKLVHGEEVDKKTLENMVKVGLWCVQDEAALRPSMKSVVMMLEGITDVSIPPCPTSPL